MIKYIKKTLLILILFISIFSVFNTSWINAKSPVWISDSVLDSKNDAKKWDDNRQAHLDNTYNEDKQFFFQWNKVWEEWVLNFLIRFAKDIKNLFLLIAFVYLIIWVLLILWTDMSDDDMKKWRNQILWTGIWIIIMQISYTTIKFNVFNKNVDWITAVDFWNNVIIPFIDLIWLLASFVFIAIAIYSFYTIITANWSEEWTKKWKLMIVYAIVWFILVKISTPLVKMLYLKSYNCTGNAGNAWPIIPSCTIKPDLSMDKTVILFTNIVNYAMWFLGIIVVLLSIYAWFLLLTSVWSEDKIKKVKNIFLYIFIWLALMLISYVLFNFYIDAKLWAK